MLDRQPLCRKKTPAPLPTSWLMVDARLGHAIPAIVSAMPPRSAVVVRPYAMARNGLATMIRTIRRVARARRHLLLIAGSVSEAGFDGRHGMSKPPRPARGWRTIPVHNRRELLQAKRLRADALLISPIWPTRSHPGAATLSARGFARLAATAPKQAVALGGMDARLFRRLRIHGAAGWAAIDAWQKPRTHR